jgi:hypothetical protein
LHSSKKEIQIYVGVTAIDILPPRSTGLLHIGFSYGLFEEMEILQRGLFYCSYSCRKFALPQLPPTEKGDFHRQQIFGARAPWSSIILNSNISKKTKKYDDVENIVFYRRVIF